MDPNAVAKVIKIFTEATEYDPTVLYYTYSTIAQTLAAAFAFVGAFILFYIQSVNQSCQRISDNIFETRADITSAGKKRILGGGWGSFLANFEYEQKRIAYLSDNRKDPEEKKEKEERTSYMTGYSPVEIRNLWHKKCNLVKEFKSLTVFVAIAIIFSLILLSLSVNFRTFHN